MSFTPFFFNSLFGGTQPSVIPHDDYDEPRPWWNTSGRQEAREALLMQMRAEIGITAKPATAQKIITKTDAVVERAVAKIAARPSQPKTEREAFDFVSVYERQYRNAIKSVLATVRKCDAEDAFRAEVKARMQARAELEREAKRKKKRRQDTDLMMLLSHL